MDDAPPLLGAYAAKQCPVRLFRQYDPTEIAVAAVPDDDLQQLFDDGIAFEDAIVAELVSLHQPGEVIVIPGRAELDHEARRVLTRDALGAVLQRQGAAIRFSPQLLAFGGHYPFEPRPVAVARGNEKGRVERAIRYVRDNFWPARTFTDLSDLNAQADLWCMGQASMILVGPGRIQTRHPIRRR